MLQIKKITSVLKVPTSIAAHAIGLSAIQAIMSVSDFKTAVILYRIIFFLTIIGNILE
jgi:hypothetical protein